MDATMREMTDIAKDYLKDFEVLTEARKEFEQQLGEWWDILIQKLVRPALEKEWKAVSSESISIWENQSNPGMFHCWTPPKQEVFIQITDPRTSERGCYTVSLLAGSQPILKVLNKQLAFVDGLEKLRSAMSENRQLGVKRSATELASVDVQINPENPFESADEVRDIALRFFAVIIVHYRQKKEDVKS